MKLGIISQACLQSKWPAAMVNSFETLLILIYSEHLAAVLKAKLLIGSIISDRNSAISKRQEHHNLIEVLCS